MKANTEKYLVIIRNPLRMRHFWARVEKTPTCWLYVGGLTPNGYGWFNNCYAHRIAYMALREEIPADIQLDHALRCPKRCVNPDHLEPAIGYVNTMRAPTITAFNAGKLTCDKGHNNWRWRKRGDQIRRACKDCELEQRRRPEAVAAKAEYDRRRSSQRGEV